MNIFLRKEITTINLQSNRDNHWQEKLQVLLKEVKTKTVDLDCKDLLLKYTEIKIIINLLRKNKLILNKVICSNPETLVSASALGIDTQLTLHSWNGAMDDFSVPDSNGKKSSDILFHQGTIRSGESFSGSKDILLFGDVNPGASIMAGRNIYVWGRLRGVAHAGKSGDRKSIIVALELRPLQIRIANEIARGPEEKPELGLAEEARLDRGQIIISPASPTSQRAFNNVGIG